MQSFYLIQFQVDQLDRNLMYTSNMIFYSNLCQRTSACCFHSVESYSLPFKKITWITKNKCVKSIYIFKISIAREQYKFMVIYQQFPFSGIHLFSMKNHFSYPIIIQFLYLPKIHHCSFKVSSVHVFKVFQSYFGVSVSLFSVSIISFSQVFYDLSVFFTISSSSLSGGLCSGNNSLAANCSSIHYEIS